jgi:uncharacterized protein HemY
MLDHQSLSQWVGNVISGGTVIGVLAGFVPAVAAFVALVWYLIQIYESATVQRWRATRRARTLARLKARVLMLEAQAKLPLPGPETGGASLHD